MLLTGARPGEICQLRVGDIQKTDGGTWYMNLLNEDDQKSSKTFTSRRRVPLHPELLKIGFFKFVERRKNDKTSDPLLFSGLERDKYGDLSAYPCRRMREAFIPQEIVLSKRQAFYSLRHNVRDALRRIKAPPDALRHISGWSEGKNVSDDYGDPGNPDFYIDYVARISYPGLDLSFLYADSKA